MNFSFSRIEVWEEHKLQIGQTQKKKINNNNSTKIKISLSKQNKSTLNMAKIVSANINTREK